MTGNVWEWCLDYFGSYNSSVLNNPTGPSLGSERVYRGGSWSFIDSDVSCSVVSRFGGKRSNREPIPGLRLAL